MGEMEGDEGEQRDQQGELEGKAGFLIGRGKATGGGRGKRTKDLQRSDRSVEEDRRGSDEEDVLR
jgi:hypothetical protein